MEQKKALNRKKLKVILVICIVMIVTAGIGLAAYIHHVDTVTLGRKVSVYRLDVSKLTVEEAQQKISEAFQNKTITFMKMERMFIMFQWNNWDTVWIRTF